MNKQTKLHCLENIFNLKQIVHFILLGVSCSDSQQPLFRPKAPSTRFTSVHSWTRVLLLRHAHLDTQTNEH